MSRRGVARALISAVVLLLPATLAGAVDAHAEPSDAAELPDAAGLTLDWDALGLDTGLFLGPDSTTTVTVPVPAGLTAVRLLGSINAPMNIEAGYLEIDDANGTLLATVDLPRPDAAAAVTPLDIDISAAPVRAATADLSFTLRTFDNTDQFCGPLRQVSISGLRTVFAGTAAPATTIANFFPPVLERVNIYAPTDADSAEQQAVLTLVSTLTRLYHPQPLDITVAATPRGTPPPPAGEMARAIAVESGGPAGLRVENAGTPAAHLQVSGSGDQLTTQVSLLVNQLQTLAQTAASRIDQAGSDTAPRGDTMTFGQLQMSGKTDVLRTSSVTVGVDRSALGPGRVDSVTVHLLADYTPVPRDDAASVVIRSNGIVVYRAALDGTGHLDATFELDRQTFGQWINLDFALTYTPFQTCGPLIAPITFQIDPRSSLTMHRGGPPLGGFGSVPSEFSPSFLVALDGSGPDQLSYAARAIAAIARLTTSQLMPSVVDLQTAVDANSGALIVADSAAIAQTSLNPPVGGEGTTVDLGLPSELRADFADGLGSIQAFADQPRDRSVVLVTTTDAWSLVDPLFAYIENSSGGWSQLTGDVLAAGAAGTATNVAIRDVAQSFEPQPTAVADPANRWLPIGVGVAVVAVIALAAAALWFRRRRNTQI